jgi:hypothetical protein
MPSHETVAAFVLAALLVLIVGMGLEDGPSPDLTGIAEQFNGTVYKISEERIMVSSRVSGINHSMTLIAVPLNLTLNSENGTKLNMTSSSSFVRGKQQYVLEFGTNVTGTVSFEVPFQGQRFVSLMKESGPVKVILPRGYTTGDRLLGIPMPTPDLMAEVDNHTVLIWNAADRDRTIDITFYILRAPYILTSTFILLGVFGLFLAVDYYMFARRMREIRELAEKGELHR